MSTTARETGVQLGKALHLAQLGRLGEAVPLVQQVLATDPANVHALRILAYCLQRAGRFADMLTVVQTAVAAAPNDPGVHRQRARALRGLGQLREAVTAARTARALDPEDYRNELVLADALLAAGGTRNILSAAEATARARKQAPESVEAHLVEGDVQRRMAEFGRARTAYQRALALEPESPHALYRLGTLDATRGRALRASPALGGTLRAAPTDPDALHAATLGARRAFWLLTDACQLPLLAVAIFVSAWRSDHDGAGGVAVGLATVVAGVAGAVAFVRWRMSRLSAPIRTLVRTNLRRPTFALAPLRPLAMALGALVFAVDPDPSGEDGLAVAGIMLTMAPLVFLVVRTRDWLLAELYYLLRRVWFRLHPGTSV